jgi:hypothetical protein
MGKLRTRAQVGAISAALAAGAITVPGSLAAHAAVTAPIACPDALPTAQAVDGLVGTGFTVERGTTPAPFTADVLGRITDGIAPGVDMIMADVSSPALTRAGGVWAGMSGSPVYTSDGKLIGSVSYGLAANSPIAGITPAAEMKRLLSASGTRAQAKAKIAVSKSQAARIAKTGDVTAAAAAAGFKRLPVPVTLSGPSAAHSGDRELQRVRKAFPDAIVSLGSAARATAAPADEIKAGGNFAGAISYGTASLTGVGTTTFVCDGEAVAFGHPFTFLGDETKLSAHTADALFVQDDQLFGPFKVANVGGVAGTVDQDRLAGIRAKLGAGPATAPITTRLSVDGGATRTLRTQLVAQPFAATVTFGHVLAAVDRGLDKIGGGSAAVTIRVRGTRANGAGFTLTRTDRLSDSADLSFALGVKVADLVNAISTQEFEDVRITSVDVAGSLSSKPSEYRVTAFKVLSGGKWKNPPSTLRVKEGGVLSTQFSFTPVKGGKVGSIKLKIAVPKGSGTNGFGDLHVAAGETFVDTQTAKSFSNLLALLRDAPSGDSVRLRFRIQNGDTGKTVTSSATTKVTRAVRPWENSFGVVAG